MAKPSVPPRGPFRWLSRLRGGLKIAAALAWSLACYLPLEVTNLVLRPWPRRRAAVQAFFLRRWGRTFARILGARVERHGPLPPPPFFLVSNHLSYLDIGLLAETGGCFIAKQEIRGWPVAGRICAAAGVIFVNRGSKRDLLRVGRLLEEAMDTGRGVILFPEGTTGRGDELLPFRPSLMVEAARSSRPVHYAVISYHTPREAPSAIDVVCWWGNQPLMPHLKRLVRQPSYRARIEYSERPIADDDRKRLAEKLRRAMGERFRPSGHVGAEEMELPGEAERSWEEATEPATGSTMAGEDAR